MKSKSYIGNRYNRVKLYKKGKFWVAIVNYLFIIRNWCRCQHSSCCKHFIKQSQ